MEHLALQVQDEATRTLPESLSRFRTHLEMHRGLMLVRAGDRDGGTAHAGAALDALQRRSTRSRPSLTQDVYMARGVVDPLAARAFEQGLGKVFGMDKAWTDRDDQGRDLA